MRTLVLECESTRRLLFRWAFSGPSRHGPTSGVQYGWFHSDCLVCEVDIVGPSLYIFHSAFGFFGRTRACFRTSSVSDGSIIEKRCENEVRTRRDNDDAVFPLIELAGENVNLGDVSGCL